MKKLLFLFVIPFSFFSCSQKNSVEEEIDSHCQSTVTTNLTEYYTLAFQTEGYLDAANDDDSKKIAVDKYNSMISYLIFKYGSSYSDVYAGDITQAKDLMESNKEVMAQSIILRTKARCAYELAAINKTQGIK